ncbi:MAG: HAD family phosphatase [Candidatus Lokiarchaeota archaeon]|nr:HAD family phosphatase [Candidatus Lokiarchaeota archaeon]
MIRNIIFDIGNVLINFKPDQFLRRFINDEYRIKEFLTKVIKTELWLNLDRGIISLEEARKEYLIRYPGESNLLLTFFAHWKEMLTPITHNIKILRELKSNDYKVYLLSNYIKEAFDYVVNRNEFFAIVDGKVISSDIKSAKPELKIYQNLFEKYDLRPERCVFIDDTEANLHQAQSLNMKTIHYFDGIDLRSELRKLKVNI